MLGHRLSEWCGHGPILEEDIALANTALDFVGQANLLLGMAATLEGAGRDADALAYLRDAIEFRNHPLVEQPNGDYAVTIVRSFLFDAYDMQVMGALQQSSHQELAGLATKAFKEATYHFRHSSQWVIRFGDGTDESHCRAQDALDELWRWTGTLFQPDVVDRELHGAGIAPDLASLEAGWRSTVASVVTEATLTLPAAPAPTARGYRRGEHTEHLGHLLAEMQVLQRQHPGATW